MPPLTHPQQGNLAELIPASCTQIPNYPHPGILFYDLTTLFTQPQVFGACIDRLATSFEGSFDYVAGLEARGFLLASALAYRAGVGLMTVRKAGKLPRATYRQDYQLEYGQASFEIHQDDLPAGSRVLLLDDVLATGGSLQAATCLLERAKLQVAGIGVLLELAGLGGRQLLEGYRLQALSSVPA